MGFTSPQEAAYSNLYSLAQKGQTPFDTQFDSAYGGFRNKALSTAEGVMAKNQADLYNQFMSAGISPNSPGMASLQQKMKADVFGKTQDVLSEYDSRAQQIKLQTLSQMLNPANLSDTSIGEDILSKIQTGGLLLATIYAGLKGK